MLLRKKKLFDIKNAEGRIESHSEEYHLTFKSKNQLPLILLFTEYKVEMVEDAKVIFIL